MSRRISSTTFTRNIGETFDAVASDKETLIVTSHERPQVALLPVAEYEALARDREELAAKRKAAVQ